jgi:hypothetical protein
MKQREEMETKLWMMTRSAHYTTSPRPNRKLECLECIKCGYHATKDNMIIHLKYNHVKENK